jgi:hypothetical protein
MTGIAGKCNCHGKDDPACGAMTMKLLKTTMIGASLLAMAGTAQADTFGPNDVSGFAELFFSHTFLTDLGPNADPDKYTGGGGGGKVNFRLNDQFTLQIDAFGHHFRNDPDDDREYAVHGLAHAGWRDSDRGYFGLFGGLLGHGYSDYPLSNFVIGGEGSVYLDNVTLFAQAGYMDGMNEDSSDPFSDVIFGRGGIRYFVNPNFKLEASGGILSGDEYLDLPVDMPFWAVEAEFKPEDSRVSWFASYDGYHENEVSASGRFDYSHTGHTVKFGMRINFGQDSLQSVDRTGASQGFFNPAILQTAYDQ